jgi:hypothetical protein
VRHLTTSSTALTTRHSVRTFKRPSITSVFTAPAAAHNLVAAIYAWGRIAAPVPAPTPCPVSWCMDCMRSGDDDPVLHQSAKVTIEASECNGEPFGRAADTTSHTIRVVVERCDGGTKGDEPAIVHVYLGHSEGPDLSPGKAREFAAALRKAKASAAELLSRDGVEDGTTGAISIIRTGRYNLQIGAVAEDGAGYVFINQVPSFTAGDVRDQARHGLRWVTQPETWDLPPAEVDQLAGAIDAATVLVEADRAAQAVSA